MKKRLLSMVLTVIMLVSLIPTSVFAAKKSVDDYFDGIPIAADPGAGTTAWKVSTKDGEEVLMSGNAGKNRSSSTLTLTFTEDTHLTFEYKVSSEARYDKCTITLGSTTLVDGVSGDQEWKGLELDAKRGDKLTVLYKKDSSGDKFDDCVYLRNFSAGEALVVTFHANNGTEDTATQKIFGGKGTLKAKTFTCEAEPLNALQAISQMCELAVVKIGTKGALIKQGEEVVHVGIMAAAKRVDTTGAGDFYAAGFLAGLCDGLSLRQCGTIGAITAGKVIEVVGTTFGEEAWADIHRLVNKVKNEKYLF